jgi:F-type H+-transporting ATPase subunit gamma
MPSLKGIRTRIASVKNTQKITKAMKLVAAARLRRAQDSMFAARPYAHKMSEFVGDLTARMTLTDDPAEAAHPLLVSRPNGSLRVILITSDRGLAGGYNSNLNRRVERLLVDEKPNYGHIDLAVVGRKGKEYFRRRKANIHKEYAGVASDSALARAREIAKDITEDFAAKRVDSVMLVYNQFKSAISQEAVVKKLLPIPVPQKPSSRLDFTYEPSRKEMLESLLPLHLETLLYQAMLEAIASEFGARMSAMDSATKNAKEMIGSLTLEYNRARQAAITKELMEIVGGAEALKG